MSDDSSPNIIVALVGGLAAIGGAALTGVFALFANRPQGIAAQQNTLNASFAQFMEQANQRIQELENRIAGDEQYINSLVEILRKHDIDVPRRPTAEVVFLQPPTQIRGAG